MSKPNSGHYIGTTGSNRFLIKRTRNDSVNLSNGVLNSIRIGSALKLDSNHNFPSIIDNYASLAFQTIIIGGDGKKRKLFQLDGSLNGKKGIFEWIIDGNQCTHRRFIENGVITGYPNQKTDKKGG